MTTTAMIPVPFEDNTLYLVEQDEKPFVVMKPIVEGMGLDWRTQARKLRSNKARWGVVIMTTPSDGGRQKSVCLPLRKLPGWLYSIDHNRVRNELRGRVIEYQNRCDDILWEHWENRQDGRDYQHGNPSNTPDTDGNLVSWKDWSQLQTERAELLAFKCATLEARTKRRQVRPGRPVTQDEVQQILTLARQGITRQEIAPRLDRSPALVSYTIRAHDADRKEA